MVWPEIEILKKIAAYLLSRWRNSGGNARQWIDAVQSEADAIQRPVRGEVDSIDFAREGSSAAVYRSGQRHASQIHSGARINLIKRFAVVAHAKEPVGGTES